MQFGFKAFAYLKNDLPEPVKVYITAVQHWKMKSIVCLNKTNQNIEIQDRVAVTDGRMDGQTHKCKEMKIFFSKFTPLLS